VDQEVILTSESVLEHVERANLGSPNSFAHIRRLFKCYKDSYTSLYPCYTTAPLSYPLSHSCAQTIRQILTMSTPASDHVLAIPKLLEQILLLLDRPSLLTSCMRVNKTWHSSITTSPSLSFTATSDLRGHLSFLSQTYTPFRCESRWWFLQGFTNRKDGEIFPQDPGLIERNFKAWQYEHASWRHWRVTDPPGNMNMAT
jgi:hypothetical protein